LDEATSALDVENQRAVLDTIVKIKEVSTQIVKIHLQCFGEQYISNAHTPDADNDIHHPLGGSDEAVRQDHMPGQW
jgi:ATP-binding cassette subfamily B (MDR/TAP) protein 1